MHWAIVERDDEVLEPVVSSADARRGCRRAPEPRKPASNDGGRAWGRVRGGRVTDRGAGSNGLRRCHAGRRRRVDLPDLPGGTGGGLVTEGVWLHPRLEEQGVRPAVEAVI